MICIYFQYTYRIVSIKTGLLHVDPIFIGRLVGTESIRPRKLKTAGDLYHLINRTDFRVNSQAPQLSVRS